MDGDTTGIKCRGKEERTNKWELGTDDPSTRDKEKRGKEEEKGGTTNPPNLADTKGEMPKEREEKKKYGRKLENSEQKGKYGEIGEKKQKYLRMSKKSSIFADDLCAYMHACDVRTYK